MFGKCSSLQTLQNNFYRAGSVWSSETRFPSNAFPGWFSPPTSNYSDLRWRRCSPWKTLHKFWKLSKILPYLSWLSPRPFFYTTPLWPLLRYTNFFAPSKLVHPVRPNYQYIDRIRQAGYTLVKVKRSQVFASYHQNSRRFGLFLRRFACSRRTSRRGPWPTCWTCLVPSISTTTPWPATGGLPLDTN